MKRTRKTYYEIKGKAELTNELTSLEASEDIIFLLCEPELWIYETADSMLSEEIIQIEVQLLYLANLSYLYLSDEDRDTDIGLVVQHLFGKIPASTGTFNKWWTINYLEYNECNEVQNDLEPKDIEIIAPTGIDYIDKRFENARLRKQ